MQAEKKRYTLKEWEAKLAATNVRKEDMNELVMNFLVTEVDPLPNKNQINIRNS